MIQVQFTDEGKLHTVTFSGEDAFMWADKFCIMLSKDFIEYNLKNLSVI